MSNLQSATPEAAPDATSHSVDTPDFRGFTPDEVLGELDKAVNTGKVPRDLGSVAAQVLAYRDSGEAALIMRLLRAMPLQESDLPAFSPNQDPDSIRDAVNHILMKAGVPTILPARNSGADVKDLLEAVAEASEDRRAFDEQAGTPLADQPAPIGHIPRHRRRLLNR